ncbi:MAG: sugar transferase [Alphaproteobacteria bacterium]|nr:sugar transferase [Alphaproteobacteria bacterium]
MPNSANLKFRASVTEGTPGSKIVFDKLFAVSALLFFAPFILVIAVLILLTDGRPVFYGHERVGHRGRRFKCLKFRTMCRDSDQRLLEHLRNSPKAKAEWEASRKLTDDPRVSLLGRILRKTSLDELPQLLNILSGDMSTVGPRPIVQDEARYYGDNFADYKSLRPGLTGLWQVSGRSDVGYQERVNLDVEYVHNRSFLLDLKIVAKTIYVVLKREGAQ